MVFNRSTPKTAGLSSRIYSCRTTSRRSGKGPHFVSFLRGGEFNPKIPSRAPFFLKRMMIGFSYWVIWLFGAKYPEDDPQIGMVGCYIVLQSFTLASTSIFSKKGFDAFSDGFRNCDWLVIDTVDGWNPAPVDMVNIPLSTGFYTSQVVQDVFHQQYESVFLVSLVEKQALN